MRVLLAVAKRPGSHARRERVIGMPMVASRQWCVLLASAVVLAACGRSAAPEPAPEGEAQASTELPPVTEPPLDRERLLFAVARAASDFATGRNDRERQLQLDGRRFEVRLRFGCEGDDMATRRWSFDEPSRVLRIRVEPELSATGLAIEALGLEPFEAVEGFWIRRPWLLQAACSTRRAPPESDAEGRSSSKEGGEELGAEQPRIGIAHFFTEQDSRTLRRDNRAYEATIRLANEEEPSTTGYDLVLSGRLTRMPDGRVIACAGGVASVPPRCIVSADFDRVTLARPDRTVVAEWSSG